MSVLGIVLLVLVEIVVAFAIIAFILDYFIIGTFDQWRRSRQIERPSWWKKPK